MQGTQISHYRLERLLGSGTYGQVYAAVHIHDPAIRVAAKVFHSTLATDPGFVESLKQECHVLHGLHHQNIVGFRDLVFSEDLPPAIIMELLEGADLKVVASRGPMAPEESLRLVRALLQGLAFSHQKGLVHRDVKPSNAFLTHDGDVKLLDFGLARAAETSRSTQTAEIQGTVDYMAPELFDGTTAAPSADVYAAGLVLWELLAGHSACPAGSVLKKIGWHDRIGAPDVKTVNPMVPHGLAEALLRLTARRDRPPDGAAALAILDGIDLTASVLPKPIVRPPTVTLRVDEVASGLAGLAEAGPASSTDSKGSGDVGLGRAPDLPSEPLLRPFEEKASVDIDAPAPVPTRPKVGMGRVVGAGLAALVIPMVMVGGAICVVIVMALFYLSASSSSSPRPDTPSPGLVLDRYQYAMIALPAGTVTLGSPPGELGREKDETRLQIQFLRPLLIGATEVTRSLYGDLMGTDAVGDFSCGASCPAERISWMDALRFCNELSEREGLEPAYLLDGNARPEDGELGVSWDLDACGYRLPTEAEWEYAARGGESDKARFAGGKNLDDVGWYFGNSDGQRHPVGQKAANGFGLYDMSGNVMELVWDSYSRTRGLDEPIEQSSGTFRGPLKAAAKKVAKGGSFNDGSGYARVAARRTVSREFQAAGTGFRLVRGGDFCEVGRR